MPFPSWVHCYRPNSASPGNKNSRVYGGRIILPSWNLIIAKVPGSSVFLVLPVTEALQGPLTMVPNGQFGLKEIEVGGGQLKKQTPREARVYIQSIVWRQLLAGTSSHEVLLPNVIVTLVGRCTDQREARAFFASSYEDYVIKEHIFFFFSSFFFYGKLNYLPNQASSVSCFQVHCPTPQVTLSCGNALDSKTRK